MAREFPLLDDTARLLVEGYAWLPNHRHRSGREVVPVRLMGMPAVAVHGPEAAELFYDASRIERRSALPGLVQDTLFGRGAVHTLDGPDHLHRKALFASLLLGEDAVLGYADAVASAWDARVPSWRGRSGLVLFDEASRVLADGAARWVGLPPSANDELAEDCVAMVDGFATLGPRHWRARRARRRQEDRLARLVEDVRDKAVPAAEGTPLYAVAHHRELDGSLLSPHDAAVELLNLTRPAVAICWFVAFAAHAFQRWPEQRARMAEADPELGRAFAHEVRRFYPFAPFLGGRARHEFSWKGQRVPAGAMVLLDVYGQNHDPGLWPDPYAFLPARFVGRGVGPYELVPQGGGDTRTGHRCPGEDATIAILRALVPRLAGLDYAMPEQDLRIPLSRIPTRPVSGCRIDVA